MSGDKEERKQKGVEKVNRGWGREIRMKYMGVPLAINCFTCYDLDSLGFVVIWCKRES